MLQGFEGALTELERLLHRDALARLGEDLADVERVMVCDPFDRFYGGVRAGLRELQRILALLSRSEAERESLEGRFAVLSDGLSASETPLERETLLAEFLAVITEDKSRLRGDRRAFARYMGFDAVRERYQTTVHRHQVREEILVKLAADVAARVLFVLLSETHGAVDEAALAVRALDLEARLRNHLRGATRWQNHVAALQALRRVVSTLPRDGRAGFYGLETASLVSRCCFNPDENLWVQRAAIELLVEIDPSEAWRVYERRLLEPRADQPEDLFVRAHIVRVLAAEQDAAASTKLLQAALARPEPSEYVRMQIAWALGRLGTTGAERLLLKLARGDDRDVAPRVRAQAVVEWRRRGEDREDRAEVAARVIAVAIRHDEAFLVRRLALEEAANLAAARQARLGKHKIDPIDRILLSSIDALIAAEGTDLALKRLAAEAREEIVVRNFPAFEWLQSKVIERLRDLPEGGEMEFPIREIGIDDDTLGRLLAFFSRDDFDLTAVKGPDAWTLGRGDRFVWRLWRVLHELRRPSPDKRQGFRHTIGRDYRGTIRAHAGTMAELTETKVPGERVYIEAEMSWRRHLPLLDDYLSLFRPELWGEPVRIYSSLGVTTIRNTNPRRRGWLRYLKLCWRYAEVAALRNANPRNKQYQDVSKYFQVLREEYGLTTLFTPWSYQVEGRAYPLRDLSLTAAFRLGVPSGAWSARPEVGPTERAEELVAGTSRTLAQPGEQPLREGGVTPLAGEGSGSEPFAGGSGEALVALDAGTTPHGTEADEWGLRGSTGVASEGRDEGADADDTGADTDAAGPDADATGAEISPEDVLLHLQGAGPATARGMAGERPPVAGQRLALTPAGPGALDETADDVLARPEGAGRAPGGTGPTPAEGSPEDVAREPPRAAGAPTLDQTGGATASDETPLGEPPDEEPGDESAGGQRP